MIGEELVLKSRQLFLVATTPASSVRSRAAGLYAQDTRYLNEARIFINGESPERLATSVHQAAWATITSTNPALWLEDDDPLVPHQVALEERIRLDSALHVDYVLENFASRSLRLEFAVLYHADFRDLFDVRGFQRPAVGTLLRPHMHQDTIHLRYRGLDDQIASTAITFDQPPRVQLRRREGEPGESLVSLLPGQDELRREVAPDDMAGVLASFTVDLAPGARWELRTSVRPDIPIDLNTVSVPVVWEIAGAQRASITTDNLLFNRLLEQSQDDLAALMTEFPEGNIPAAGIPWYVAPFGRDSLIAGLQTFHLTPQEAEGTLRVLAALQGQRVERETEEEPGKILHEMRYGEMARIGEIPHRPYFGTIDATSLFVLLFAETVAWGADDALYADLLPAVNAALTWIDTFGDPDRDGFIEYHAGDTANARSRHQVWKDSFDSLHYVDGRDLRGNVAAVEVQGYTYAALRRLADVALAFGDSGFADDLQARAQRLAERFHPAFWMEDERFYAQALDWEKTQVGAISSNPGQLLFTGIVPDDCTADVVRRLRRPDMDAGWGIRTLSSAASTYNPMSYHNGSIWPHDNALIAAGCYAVGEIDAGHAIFEALYDAGRFDPGSRLSELYCGFRRGVGATDCPVPYPAACSPQAWAAGCYPQLVRSALGLRADIGRSQLQLAPNLPGFLNEVTLHNLTALGRTGSLTVRKEGVGYEVICEGLPIDVTQSQQVVLRK